MDPVIQEAMVLKQTFRDMFKNREDVYEFDESVTIGKVWTSLEHVLDFLRSKIAYIIKPAATWVVKYGKGDQCTYEIHTSKTLRETLKAFKFEYVAEQELNGRDVNKTYNASNYLAENTRTTFRSIVFDPADIECTQDENRECLNIYTGMAFSPDPDFVIDPEKTAPFLAHIRNVLASGNELHAQWIITWLAHMVQLPGVKPGCSILFKSDQGTGKTAFFKIVKKLLGRNLAISVDCKTSLVARFNGHIANKLLVVAEETLVGKDEVANDKIKSMITSETINIERKGMEIVTTKSFERYVFFSNHDCPLRLEPTDRRMACFEVSNARRNDHAYFAALEDLYSTTANLEHVFQHLHRHRPSGLAMARILVPIDTALRQALISRARGEYNTFILDLANKDNGCEEEVFDEGVFYTAIDYFASFKKWAEFNGFDSRRADVRELGSRLKAAGLQCQQRRGPRGAPSRGYTWSVHTVLENVR